MGTAIRPESKIERDRDGISFHNCHVPLWYPVHIFSQERQTRGKPRRLVRRVPSSCDSRFGYRQGLGGRKIRKEQALKTNDEAVAWQLINQMVVSRETRPTEPPKTVIQCIDEYLQLEATRGIGESTLKTFRNALIMRLMPVAWIVRTRAEPQSFSSVIQTELKEASGGLPVARALSLEEIVGRSTAREDFNAMVLTTFAGLAMLLAATGIYGLMAYSVEQRQREIGIRIALGAESTGVRNMVVVQGMRLGLIGVSVGMAGSFASLGSSAACSSALNPWTQLFSRPYRCCFALWF